ncbi:hypothetical protein EOPP23_10400 [Endozoicomonas sp. OPT23]|uniref:hypothetical protein n=1 Tax=Endozoicomonas sp. OPT23 TaxID=2072845 RepID=UPI00129B167A|nr:hypothetical protein [Endozoicomonas sp. OPT23]MRI33395.1 hypothetical protein [Endozoicomonas sp. OPT23]
MALAAIKSHLPNFSSVLNRVKEIYQQVKAQGLGRTIQKLFSTEKNYMIRNGSSGCHKAGVEYEWKHKKTGDIFVETPKRRVYFLKDREGCEVKRNFTQYLADHPARLFLKAVLPEDKSKLQ